MFYLRQEFVGDEVLLWTELHVAGEDYTNSMFRTF